MTGTQREMRDGKPLGDSGTGASGGGSIGNMPGGAATGGDSRQGVRAPDAASQGNASLNTTTEAADSHRNDHHSKPLKPDVPKDGSKSGQTETEAALPSTIDKNPRPTDI